MAKKKLDKNLIKDVAGGELAAAMDGSGKFEIVDANGISLPGRTFNSIEQAAQVAKQHGLSTEYLTFDERLKRQSLANPRGKEEVISPYDLDQIPKHFKK